MAMHTVFRFIVVKPRPRTKPTGLERPFHHRFLAVISRRERESSGLVSLAWEPTQNFFRSAGILTSAHFHRTRFCTSTLRDLNERSLPNYIGEANVTILTFDGKRYDQSRTGRTINYGHVF